VAPLQTETGDTADRPVAAAPSTGPDAGVELPATLTSLWRARSLAADAGRRAGFPEHRVEGLQVAAGELALAAIAALPDGGSLVLSTSRELRTVRIVGRGVGLADPAVAPVGVQLALIEALSHRFSFSVDETGARFELVARRPGASTTRLPTRAEERELFREYRRTRDPELRNRLVEVHRPVAIHVAQRYRFRGEPFDDLVQVACIGVLKAVERFEPDRGLHFTTFATATIEGELKRHFRDTTWTVRVPRGDQELHLTLREASSSLAQELGHPPTTSDLAGHLGVSEGAVRSATAVGASRSPMSLDVRGPDDRELDRWVASADTGLGLAEDREVLRRLLDRLAPRDRRILYLRYFEGLSQSEIAADVGVSQMHVSRLLTQLVANLRARVQRPAGLGQ
jgi:RNA polymerase sigma-B factor